jgi:hypothetical protein
MTQEDKTAFEERMQESAIDAKTQEACHFAIHVGPVYNP